MRKINKMIRGIASLCLSMSFLLNGMVGRASGEKIRDVARLNTDVPNELIGMGLVVGLNGTGDGGDFLPAIRPLMALLKRFDDTVPSEKELKNANDIAMVHLSMKIQPGGARAGEQIDVEVSALAAKSLKGGQLVISPMFVPRPNAKIRAAFASGTVVIDDPAMPTKGVIHLGGTLTRDILPVEITDGHFTLVLHPNTANMETATAIADRINEEVSAQTDGMAVATAVNETSVDVTIPKVEQGNVAGFIARIRQLPLPNISEPAKVIINSVTKTILFTDEVEIATTHLCMPNGFTVTIGTPAGTTGPNGSTPGMATMKDLEDAFNMLKVSPADRIDIVKLLYKSNALKAELVIQ
jgi:flagellar P-ring protein precursor FlgI